MKKSFAIVIATILIFTFLFSAHASGNEISYGKSYNLITPSSSAYPDKENKLTDGVFGSIPDGKNNYYSSGAYVGFNQVDVNENGYFIVLLDLGKIYYDLSAFTIGFLNETDVGIYAPKSVSFAVAKERNDEYTEIGSLNTQKSTSSGQSETYAMTLATDDIEGRFIRITIEHLAKFTDENGVEKNSGWTFIDEIIVFSSGNSETSNESNREESNQISDDIEPDSSREDISDYINQGELIKPGDNNFGFVVWILLAIASFAITAALFLKTKRKF